MKTLVAVAALALLAVAVPAQAQGDPQGIILEVTSPGTLQPLASGEIGFSLDVGCAEMLGAPGEGAVVTLVDAPAWLNFTEQTPDLSPPGCLTGQGRVEVTGAIPFTLSASAPAVVQHVVKVRATVGDSASNEPTATYTVAYTSDYSLTPSASFPLEVTNKTTSFTVTGVQASNAPSMIMVDGFNCDSGALISGIGPLQYANKAGAPDTKTYTVTFTAPGEDWEKVTCTLKVYGHFNFDGNAGPPTDQKAMSWEFTNGGVPDEESGGGGKKSPAPVGALTALGLLGFAALMRRRQA